MSITESPSRRKPPLRIRTGADALPLDRLAELQRRYRELRDDRQTPTPLRKYARSILRDELAPRRRRAVAGEVLAS